MTDQRTADAGLPADVHADSRNRLPLITREQLDEAGQQLYDSAANNPQSLAGLRGPGGIRLHNPELTALSRGANRYLRFSSGLDRKLVELAILVSAREMDARFEWHAHEAEARKEGLSAETVDVVRFRKPTTGLDEKEAVLIELGRQAIGKHKVEPPTFAAALKLFGPKNLVSFTAIMGEYASTAILLTVFDQQLPPGATSALPVP
jgi:4-carboxymuconolactone decarboxylase